MTKTDRCLTRTLAQTRVEIAAGRVKLRPFTVQTLVRRIDLLLIEEPEFWSDSADEE